MFNPMKAGRTKLLKAAPKMISYLKKAKQNGLMAPDKADQLISQLEDHYKTALMEGEMVPKKEEKEEEEVEECQN